MRDPRIPETNTYPKITEQNETSFDWEPHLSSCPGSIADVGSSTSRFAGKAVWTDWPRNKNCENMQANKCCLAFEFLMGQDLKQIWPAKKVTIKSLQAKLKHNPRHQSGHSFTLLLCPSWNSGYIITKSRRKQVMLLVEGFDGLRHQVLGKVPPTSRSIEHSANYLRNSSGCGDRPKSKQIISKPCQKKESKG